MQKLIDQINKYGYFVQLYQYSHNGRWEAQATVKGGKSLQGHFAFADTPELALAALLTKTIHIGHASRNEDKASVNSFHPNVDDAAPSAPQKPKKQFDPFEDEHPDPFEDEHPDPFEDDTEEKDAFE